MAEELEGNLASWVDFRDLACNGIEDDAVFEHRRLNGAKSSEDANVFRVDLTEDEVHPLIEFWDVYELPSLVTQPKHLNRAQVVETTETFPTGDVDLASKT